jgi:hypothetical protein
MPNSRTFALTVSLGFIPILVFLALHFSLLPAYDANTLNRDAATGTRLITTVDGFFYARLADDLLKGQYRKLDQTRPAPRPVPVPAIVSMTAGIARITGLPLHTVVFFLPPVLAFLSIPLMWAWARRVFPETPWAPAVVATAISVNYTWFTRTTFGKFDTDGLNLVLFWAIGFFLYSFAKQDGNKRYASLAMACFSFLLLVYWWPAVGLPLGLLMAFLFSCTIVFPSPRFDRLLKATILSGALAGLAIILLAAFTDLLPRALTNLIAPYLEHVALIRGEAASVFPTMGKTIAELRSLGLGESLVWVAGAAYVAPFAVLGLAALCVRSPRMIFLLVIPTALFAVLSADGLRFLLFLAPGFAFGITAFVVHILLPLVQSVLKSRKIAQAAALAAAIGLIAPGFTYCMDYELRPSFNANMVNLPKLVNDVAGPNAIVWNWWGPGYMIEYYGNRRTFIDGGLQEPERSWVAAVPLASHDYVFAKNWIRFFAKNGTGVQVMTRRLKSTEKATLFLKHALRDEAALPSVLKEYGLSEEERNWRKFLFPEVEVYLVLLSDMLTHGSWLPIGQHVPGDDKPIEQNPFYIVPNQNLRLNATKGLLLLPDDQALPISRFYTITPDQLRHDRYKQPGIVVVGVQGTDYVIYMGEDNLNTLALNLLFVHPADTPGFMMLRFNPFIGGVWKVE